MIVKLEEDENGDSILKLPDEIIEKYNLKEGDTVHWTVEENGKIIITFN